jgi:hypothetical protein
MVHYEQQTREFEKEDRVETAIVGLCYTGPRSSVPPRQPRRRGGWPGTRPFQGGPAVERDDDGTVIEREPGPIQIGVNPDWLDETVEGGTIVGLEALEDFEVIYDAERIAEALLARNYLPSTVFGQPPDQTGGQRAQPVYEVRRQVFEFLGLDDIGSGPGSHDEYRQQLATLAGVELEDESETVEATRVQKLQSEHTRAELKDAVDVLRSGPDEMALTGGKSEFAEWLAQQDQGDVRAALAGEYDAGDDDPEGDNDIETQPESEA